MKFLICLFALASVAVANPSLNYLCQNMPDDTMKANPYNCNGYVQCNGNIAFEQRCPEDLQFDEAKQYCDYKENVNCIPLQNIPVRNQAAAIINPNPKCVGVDPNVSTLFSHEFDCNKFYMCDGVNAVQMDCPPELHFNNVAKYCDFPENAGCR